LGHDGHRDLGVRVRPNVQTGRLVDAGHVVDPAVGQPFRQGPHPERADQPDVSDRAAQCCGQRGTGQILVVAYHHQLVDGGQVGDQSGRGGRLVDDLRLPAEDGRTTTSASASGPPPTITIMVAGNISVAVVYPRLGVSGSDVGNQSWTGVATATLSTSSPSDADLQPHRLTGAQSVPQVDRQVSGRKDHAPDGAAAAHSGQLRLELADLKPNDAVGHAPAGQVG
jgi:hypothetical protein